MSFLGFWPASTSKNKTTESFFSFKIIQRKLLNYLSGKGLSINDVMVLGGRGQGCCDNSTKASVMKSVTIVGGGVKKCPNLSDVIDGRPLSELESD
jgi:hypothetical protein